MAAAAAAAPSGAPRLDVRTERVRGMMRVLSLLLWHKSDVPCQLLSTTRGDGLRISVCDGGKSMGAAALLRDDLFSQFSAPPGIRIGLNLAHLVNALSLFKDTVCSISIVHPSGDGRLVVETGDPLRRTTVRLATQVCDRPIDFGFASSPMVADAAMRAELLREIAETLEEMVQPARDGDVTVSFSKSRGSMSFQCGGASGDVRIDCSLPVPGQSPAPGAGWLQSIEVRESGETKVRLEQFLMTIKTDYFKDHEPRFSGPLQASGDKVSIRVNATGQLCILYHVKPYESAGTSGAECIINPLVAGADSLELQEEGWAQGG